MIILWKARLMPGRAFPVAKKTTVRQKDFTQKTDSVTIKKINSCRQKC